MEPEQQRPSSKRVSLTEVQNGGKVARTTVMMAPERTAQGPAPNLPPVEQSTAATMSGTARAAQQPPRAAASALGTGSRAGRVSAEQESDDDLDGSGDEEGPSTDDDQRDVSRGGDEGAAAATVKVPKGERIIMVHVPSDMQALSQPQPAVTLTQRAVRSGKFQPGDLVYLTAREKGQFNQYIAPLLPRASHTLPGDTSATCFALARVKAVRAAGADEGGGQDADKNRKSCVELEPGSMVWIRVPLKQLQSDLGLPETAATRSRSTKKSNIKVQVRYYARVVREQVGRAEEAAAAAAAGAAGRLPPSRLQGEVPPFPGGRFLTLLAQLGAVNRAGTAAGGAADAAAAGVATRKGAAEDARSAAGRMANQQQVNGGGAAAVITTPGRTPTADAAAAQGAGPSSTAGVPRPAPATAVLAAGGHQAAPATEQQQLQPRELLPDFEDSRMGDGAADVSGGVSVAAQGAMDDADDAGLLQRGRRRSSEGRAGGTTAATAPVPHAAGAADVVMADGAAHSSGAEAEVAAARLTPEPVMEVEDQQHVELLRQRKARKLEVEEAARKLEIKEQELLVAKAQATAAALERDAAKAAQAAAEKRRDEEAARAARLAQELDKSMAAEKTTAEEVMRLRLQLAQMTQSRDTHKRRYEELSKVDDM